MDEQNKNNITNLNISINEDNETYTVNIVTDSHTIYYPKTRVTFGISESIVFPIAIQILNKDGDVVNGYGLNLAKPSTDNELPSDEANEEETEEKSVETVE